MPPAALISSTAMSSVALALTPKVRTTPLMAPTPAILMTRSWAAALPHPSPALVVATRKAKNASLSERFIRPPPLTAGRVEGIREGSSDRTVRCRDHSPMAGQWQPAIALASGHPRFTRTPSRLLKKAHLRRSLGGGLDGPLRILPLSGRGRSPRSERNSQASAVRLGPLSATCHRRPGRSVPLSSAGFAGATNPGGRSRKGGEAPLRGTWRPRPHAQRTGSTPRVRPSGAALHLDLLSSLRVFPHPVKPDTPDPGARGRAVRLPENLRHLLVGQLLHVPEHEERAVVFREPVEGRLEDLPRLAREQLVLRGVGPIRQHPGPVSFAMAVGEEGRQAILQADLQLAALAPALDERGIGRDPIEPGPESRPSLEGIDLPEKGQERVLHDLFGLRVVARDPEGHTVEAGAVALHQRFERRVVPRPQARDQRDVGGGLGESPLRRFRRHHVAVSSRALICSATKREQFRRATRSSRSLHSRRTPSRLTNETLARSRLSPAPIARIGSHTCPSSSTHGPMTCPSRCNVGPPLGLPTRTILSISRIPLDHRQEASSVPRGIAVRRRA